MSEAIEPKSIKQGCVNALCIEADSCPLIRISDSRSSFVVFSNKQNERVLKIHIDDKRNNKITGPRCDWLLESSSGVGHFVELKSGSGVEEAIAQLEETISLLSKKTSGSKYPKSYAFAVSRCKPRLDTTVQKAKQRFRKNFNSNLNIIPPYSNNLKLHHE